MAEHNELGKFGEALAKEYLIKKGYIIKKTNWRYGKDEIDIIAQDKDFLVIVEVKTRSSNYLVEPEFAVTKKKQKFLIRATEMYINFFDVSCETRFDIISIIVLPDKNIIKHIEDAFYPTL